MMKYLGGTVLAALLLMSAPAWAEGNPASDSDGGGTAGTTPRPELVIEGTSGAGDSGTTAGGIQASGPTDVPGADVDRDGRGAANDETGAEGATDTDTTGQDSGTD